MGRAAAKLGCELRGGVSPGAKGVRSPAVVVVVVVVVEIDKLEERE